VINYFLGLNMFFLPQV